MTLHVARFLAPHFLQHGSRQMCPTYAYEMLMPLTGRELCKQLTSCCCWEEKDGETNSSVKKHLRQQPGGVPLDGSLM